MRHLLPIAFALAFVLGRGPDAVADKQFYERSRDVVESALDLVAELRTQPRIRPKEPVQLGARLVNRSGGVAVKVIRPGNGCGMGIVEPHLHYTARYRASPAEAWRRLKVRSFEGMCGMGDYRWHRNVMELAPGEALDLTPRLPAASTYVAFDKPGQYEVRLHYAFRRRGTTEKLPQADPVGDLGPMRRMPAYDIVSDPVHVTVLRPIEVVVEALGRPAKGVARRLSDLVRVRVENWTDKPLALEARRLKVVVRVRAGQGTPPIRRKPLSVVAGFVKRTLAPGEAAVLVGPGGIYDEAWVAETDGSVAVQAVVAGVEASGPRVRSHWVTLEGP